MNLIVLSGEDMKLTGKKLKKEAGMTLIEVVLSMILLFIVFMAVSEIFMGTFKYFARMKNRNEACIIAQFTLENEIFKTNDGDKKTKVVSCSPTTVPYKGGYYSYRIQAETPYDGRSDLVKVTLFARWPVTSSGGSILAKTQEVFLTTICPEEEE